MWLDKVKRGVLYNKKISLKVKGKFYKSVVRPAMMYRLKCLIINKKEELKTKVPEMEMLRWMHSVTRFNRIGNEYIR